MFTAVIALPPLPINEWHFVHTTRNAYGVNPRSVTTRSPGTSHVRVRLAYSLGQALRWEPCQFHTPQYAYCWGFCDAMCSNRKMVAVSSSEMLVPNYGYKRRHNPENQHWCLHYVLNKRIYMCSASDVGSIVTLNTSELFYLFRVMACAFYSNITIHSYFAVWCMQESIRIWNTTTRPAVVFTLWWLRDIIYPGSACRWPLTFMCCRG